MRTAVGLLGHERPLQPCGKTGSAPSTQARRLHLIDDPIAPLLEDGLGALPGTARARPLKGPVMQAVQIGEDAVLVLEHQDCLCVEASLAGGLGIAASRILAGSPAFLAARAPKVGCCGCPPLPAT